VTLLGMADVLGEGVVADDRAVQNRIIEAKGNESMPHGCPAGPKCAP
jgi:hypothetical protein